MGLGMGVSVTTVGGVGQGQEALSPLSVGLSRAPFPSEGAVARRSTSARTPSALTERHSVARNRLRLFPHLILTLVLMLRLLSTTQRMRLSLRLLRCLLVVLFQRPPTHPPLSHLRPL